MNDEGPIGQRFEFVYQDGTYLVEILDSTSLRWTRTVGNPVGATDVEQYVWSRIADQQWMITWIEATGLGLSNLVDVADGVLVTHGNSGRDVFTNVGQIRVVS